MAMMFVIFNILKMFHTTFIVMFMMFTWFIG